MSESGQSLHLPIFVMSASTPLATVERTFQNRRFVPLCDVVPLTPVVRPVARHRRKNVFMPKEDAAINEIKALEDRRYQAMLDGDTAILDALCSGDLIYTHSTGDHDDKQSYLHKVGSRHFTYLEITHPADRILVVDGAALVTGRMTAKVLVSGTVVHVD